MVEQYSAGEVGVDVKPVPKGWEEFEARLRKLASDGINVEARIDADLGRYRAATSGLDGKSYKQTVKLDAELTNVDKARDSWRKLSKDFTADAKVKADDAGMAKAVSKMATRYVRGFNDIFNKAKVIEPPALKLDQWQQQLDEQRKSLTSLNKQFKPYGDELKNLGERMDELNSKSNELHDGLEKAIGDGDRAKVSALRRELRSLNSEIDSVSKQISKTQDASSKIRESIKSTRREIDSLHKRMDRHTTTVNEVSAAYGSLSKNLARMATAKLADFDRMGVDMSQAAVRTRAFNEAQKDTTNSIPKARAVVAEYSRQAKEFSEDIGDQEQQLYKLQKALASLRPSDAGDRLNDDLTRLNSRVRGLRAELERNPLRIHTLLDEQGFEDGLRRELENLRERAEVEVRVTGWRDSATELEERLNRLKRERIDVPADISFDHEDLSKRMRDLADAIESDPSNVRHVADLKANLDIDMQRAERRLDEWKRSNEEFKMDLDLQTALASAHLAYFTRPRTVDIYAQFHGSDLGRVIDGLTVGATGIRGVRNEFEKFVNLMDNLDTIVPKAGMIGSVLASLGAGAVNVAGTIGGIGSSILSMSKAAFAAPAAITGMASALYVLYQAWGDKGATFKENVDLTNTALGGLSDKVVQAFYKEATPALTSMADAIGDQVTPGLTGMATAEGLAAAGIARMIAQANEADKLSTIFNNSNEAVTRMVPGLESLTATFFELGSTGSEVLPDMADWFSENTERLREWVQQASESGRVNEALREAAEQGGYLKDSIGSLIGIMSGVFGVFAEGENGIQGFSEALASADRAVNSFKFQDTLRAWREGAQDAQEQFRGVFSQIGDDAYNLRDVTSQVFSDAGATAATALKTVSSVLRQSKTGISDFSSGLRDGFREAFGALDDAGPMFNQLLSMTGSLSRTFGGTFANTLRTAAPMIQAIATAATGVANAFNALPAPMQAAIGLWATFGRTWTNGISSLKQSMLTNIQQTLQYKTMLAQLGVQAQTSSMGFRELAQAMRAVNGSGVTSALSSNMGMFTSLNAQAKASGEAMAGLSRNVAETAAKTTVLSAPMGKLGNAVKTVGGWAKTAGSAILGMFGGPAGLAVTAGLTAIGTAMNDYQSKANATAEASANVSNAIASISSTAQQTANGLGVLGSAIKQNLSDPDVGETGWNWLSDMMTGFDSVSDASKVTGVSIDQMSKAVAGGRDSYEKLLNQLQPTEEAMNELTGQALNGIIGTKDDTSARVKLVEALKQQRESALENLRTTAVANGYSEKRVNTLEKEGASLEQIAAKIQSKTQLEQNHAQAMQMVSQAQAQEADASIRASQAASQYATTYQGMGETISQVQALMAQGQSVWNSQTQDFDYFTEAGRMAANSLNQLASGANSYMDAMIDAGKPQAEVISKQGELRDQFVRTATQMTGNADAAKRLADQYLMTPKEIETTFKANVAQAKADMQQYLGLTRDLFPDGKKGDQEHRIVMKAVSSGAISDLTQLQGVVDRISNGADARAITLMLNADGDAEWKTENVANNLKALGMQPKDLEWLLNANGTAEERAQRVRDALSDLNLTDKQIQWILDCIDNVTEKADTAKTAIENVPEGWSTHLNADGNTVSIANESKNAVYHVPLDWITFLQATGNTTPFANEAELSVNAIPPEWFTKIDSDGNTKISAEEADRAVRNIPKDWQSKILASTSGSAEVVALKEAIQAVKSKSVSIRVTTFHEFIESHVTRGNYAPGVSTNRAKGGRIKGPGTWTSDSVPTNLSTNEYVIRAASVDKIDKAYGRNALDVINRYGVLPASNESQFLKQAVNTAAIGRSVTNAIRRQGNRFNVTVAAPSSGVSMESMEQAALSALSKVSGWKLDVDERRLGYRLTPIISKNMRIEGKRGK
ncbi:hypothetical protein [Bifidobacterium oedipodis]|uniref:Uncharacterized protein n=1 Tax=Bifidobacterium oedipodis TaxID=2675322 RepID=A0A7Y0EP76_9BIFI|nr:hypothetical protein [Bifidobacterium sp. DSM 109957]NMM93864.1 hypothetical protein [Bifidobacterium sp. DSM 109957]